MKACTSPTSAAEKGKRVSVNRRRVFAVVFVIGTVAALTLVAQLPVATLAGRGGDKVQTEVATAQVDEALKIRKVTNNKGKSAPGMCVYSEENDEFAFRNVLKGNLDENDPVLIEIDKGGHFADSQADCDELNTERANARANPSQHHTDFNVVEVNLDENPEAERLPEPRNGVPSADNIPPPEAEEALQVIHQKTGTPKAKHDEP